MSEIKLDKFDQIGIVVKDIEKAANLYRALFNFKGNIDIVEQEASVVCRGESGTYKMKKIMDFFGGKQLEIVEIIDAEGPNLYSEYLDEGREGLHHLGIYIKDAKPLKKKFKEEFTAFQNLENQKVEQGLNRGKAAGIVINAIRETMDLEEEYIQSLEDSVEIPG